ncbi:MULTISPECIES: hypothetical protein [unclassified Rathayibacter]|uniref:hypothetical protein n=1 Tax=unclassified Rathayibacter TaxID=2609250 RepID=UPI000CE82D6C|nr:MULTISPECIES: hypothetical protein [unclassified Rathayibacter]PPF24071.1 hypothetical protein C5C54_16860 [Rathayibacter sp. AY1F2]PPG48982.1 hypothetical protein C5C41_16205 [Rathayibacter sp. AY1E9]PPH36826.1 hypothetical protein C5C86_15740 [Rathayibacter sp. AY1E4]PPH41474.1 hypothetical protein C5C42_16475 [Rathayibacter sp. AY1F7]
MVTKLTRILIVGAPAVVVLGTTAAVVAFVSTSDDPYYPREGLNTEYAATLVQDLAANDPRAELMTHFPASNQDSVTELISECAPAAQADARPTVYSDVVPANARVILDAPGLPRCDMYLFWSESQGEAWAVHLTDPSPQDPVATLSTTPGS